MINDLTSRTRLALDAFVAFGQCVRAAFPDDVMRAAIEAATRGEYDQARALSAACNKLASSVAGIVGAYDPEVFDAGSDGSGVVFHFVPLLSVLDELLQFDPVLDERRNAAMEKLMGAERWAQLVAEGEADDAELLQHALDRAAKVLQNA